MKKIFLFLTVAVLLTFSACDSYLEGHEIIGKWEHDGRIYEFKKNGVVSCDGSEYDFYVSEGKITIDKNGNAEAFDYNVNHNGTLTLNETIFYPCG